MFWQLLFITICGFKVYMCRFVHNLGGNATDLCNGQIISIVSGYSLSFLPFFARAFEFLEVINHLQLSINLTAQYLY